MWRGTFALAVCWCVLVCAGGVMALVDSADPTLSCLGLLTCPTNGYACSLGGKKSAFFNKCNTTLSFQLFDDRTTPNGPVWLRIGPLDYPQSDNVLPYAFDYLNYGIGAAIESPPAKPVQCAVLSSANNTLMNRCQAKIRVLLAQYCLGLDSLACKPTPPAQLTWVAMYGAEVGSNQNLIPDVAGTSRFCGSDTSCVPKVAVIGQVF